MKKVLAILITILVALAAGFAGGVYYAGLEGDSYDEQTIEEKLFEVSELTTLELAYTDEGDYSGDAKKLLGHDIPFTKKAMKIQYSGVVKMGPNMENMKLKLDNAAKKLTVRIPHSEILSHEIDEDSIQIIYIKNGVFNSVTPENTNQLRKDTKAKKEKSIKESGSLEQADQKAVEQITTFLNTVYPDLEVEVKVK